MRVIETIMFILPMQLWFQAKKLSNMAAVVEMNSCQLFKELRKNGDKYQRFTEPLNIMGIKDSWLFIWNVDGQCVLASKLKYGDTDPPMQTLLLTNAPLFEVTSILFNSVGNLLVLYGLSGVMVIEMPRKWGNLGCFEGGKDKILCKSWNIAECFFVYNNRVNVAHTAWHPGSETDSHLTILSNDNYLRIYDVFNCQTPYQVIALSSSPQSFYLTTNSRATFSSCLGETAVSFDFGPSSENDITDKEEAYWPIFILKGNGDVFVINSNLKKNLSFSGRVKGPLTMHPPAVDNYGVDSCSLICLNLIPPVLVIASSYGILYHCIVLGKLETVESYEEVLQPVLYVYEKVELSLALTTLKNNDDKDDIDSSSICLYKDPGNNVRYHCVHAAGIHSVALPLVQKLEEFIETDDPENVLLQLENQESIVEHILCTQPLSTTPPSPLLGFGIDTSSVRNMLCVLLSSWEFINLPLYLEYRSQPPNFVSTTNDGSRKSGQKEHNGLSFEQYILNLLKPTVTTPLLKSQIGDSQPSFEATLQVLHNATQRLREEYINKLTDAQTQVEKRMKALQVQKKQQMDELQRHLSEKEELCSKQEQLAEKYEEVYTNQQKLSNRIEQLLRKLKYSLPVLSKAEMSMKHDLKSLEDKLETLKISSQSIRAKFDNQQKKIAESKSLIPKEQDATAEFTDNQLQALKDILKEETNSISELIRKVNILKKNIGI